MAGMVGRSQLGERLAQTWTQVRHGGSRIVVLVGEAGIGKSSMLSWLAAHIGAPAATVSCRGGDIAPPMSTAAEILAALPFPMPAQPLGTEVDSLRAAEVLRRGLEGSSPMALLVDDIHEADPSSRTALNLALRRSTATGLLTVITGRPMTPTLVFSEGFEVEEVLGLNSAEATVLLDSAAEAPIAPRVAQRLLRVAKGNPLALTHLPRALSPEQLSGAELLPEAIPLVGDLRTVFTRQLPPPDSPARRLLDLAAVSGDGQWRILTQLFPNAASALAHLEDAGLAQLQNGHLLLQHPLLRSAAVRAMSPQRWRTLNLELAAVDALTEDVRLTHRARGTVGPDEDLVDALVDSARLTRMRGGTDAAAQLLDRAVDLTGSGSRRAQLQLEAAQLLSAAGEAATARHRLEALLADPAAHDLHVAATLTLAILEALNGAPAAAWQRLTQCLAVASPPELGLIHARISIPLGLLGLVGEIVANADAAVDYCKPDSPEWNVARLIRAHGASAQDERRANQLVDELSDGADLVELVEIDPMVGLHIGRALSIAERYDTAITTLTALSARLHGEGARTSLAMTFGALGETWVRASRFDEALVCLDEAIALSLATGQRAFAPFWLSLRARVQATRGDDDAAQQDLELGFAISDEQSTFGARYFLLANAGLVALTAQNYDRAITLLEESWAFEQATGLLAPQLARWHADLVEAYAVSGRRPEAAPIVAHLSAVAATPGASRWTRATALRARALLSADPDDAARLLDEALTIYDPELDAFDRARTLLLKAEHDNTADTRTAALYAFRRLGAPPWAARLTDTGVSPGADALTHAETRVLAEVAKGLTNRQIAKRLDVSTKTVANHLYHAYRKLGVASRTEAARHVLLNDPLGAAPERRN